MSDQEILESSRTATAAAAKDVEPLSGALSLEGAIARSFKFNLDQRTKMMEQAIAANVWKAGQYDMLPRAMAMAGYRYRDKELITRSRDSVTGQPSLAHPFISSERNFATYDLGASWNVLDFTVSYYTARQNADRILIASEQRRKAMHALSRDVTIAFWRMVSAQQLREQVKTTIATAEAAIADAAQANAEGIRSPGDNLRYQRQMWENIRLLSNIEKEFATARVTLAKLINAPMNVEFTVVEPASAPNIKVLDVPVEQMEELALVHNAELKEHIYGERIASQEVRKAIARFLPNLSLNFNTKYHTDDYLINQNWSEAGVLLSQNLTSLLAAPANRRIAKAGVELANQKRIAAQMALIAQVHVARLELASSFRQLELADRIWELDEGIKRFAESRQEAKADSQLTQVAASTASIVSMLRRYQALAEFNAAIGSLQSTLGLEIDLDSVSTKSVDDLAAIVRQWQATWNSGSVPSLTTQPTT